MEAVRVLVADDNAQFRQGLRALRTASDDMDLAGEAATGEEVISLLSLIHISEPTRPY